jgi:serine/threonine-protein kinase
VLYEMLTGFPPFFGGDLNAVIDQVINQTPAAPSSRNKGVAPVFDHIVAKAMAKNPDERYATAQAMATDLRNFRDFAVWRPAGDAAVLRPAVGATALSDSSTSSRAAIPVVDASLRQRRNAIVYGIPVALFAILGGWALLAKRGPEREQAVPSPKNENSAVAMPAATPVPPTELVRAEEERVQRLAASESAAAPKPTPSVAEEASSTPRAAARVALAVTPWGEVYVDGKKRGVTPPMTELQLTPGKHAIEIRNTNFQPYRRTVELGAGGRLKIKHKFE